MKSLFTISGVLLILCSCSLLNAKKSSESGLKPGKKGKTGPSKIFPFKTYEEFQISDGIAGHSLDKAKKMFVEPFQNISFKDITQTDLNNIATMSQFAIDNEIHFNEAIRKFESKRKHRDGPLSAGKTANKVLKLLSAIQVLEVHEKVGITLGHKDERLKELNAKLKKNVELDHKNAGKKMESYLHHGIE
ncbi:hypothetical protein PCASD_01247 [Puccinia coronata f. sp. avenae]|uniref:Lipoprotein n=1 Tax=Puccinia coronata f. sp. avenae TaxID=200324 RepID=A0A2N5VJ36_9BASI|nr:hypothetical protein PCASD_01247 [Puccinia coronata f. sp. avenae]